MNAVKTAFESQTVVLELAVIEPLKVLRQTVKRSVKYLQIRSSIKAAGVIEPPVVLPKQEVSAGYLLLDGHLRIEALKDLGETRVACLVATQDDTYSYNKRINRITVAQEHRMVLRALERGASVETIATALNLDVSAIHRRARLLKGIALEVVDLLGDQPVSMVVFDALRQMSPLRQIETAELMAGQGNFSRSFAEALLAATPDEQRVRPAGRKRAKASPRAQRAQMERELAAVQSQIRSVEDAFGLDALRLTMAKGYLTRLLQSQRVVDWLGEHQPEYLTEFRAITQLSKIEQSVVPGPQTTPRSTARNP
jgi:ParB-like chromosome segregation protein Spo0J